MLNQEFRSSKRGKAFTEQEKLLLYQCMLPDLDFIDNKAMDSVNVVRKAEAWRRVTVKFNSDPTVCQRTTEQLKKCFENAKCRKQWVVDSGTGILQPSGQTTNARAASKFFQTRNGVASIHDNTINFGGYEDHPDIHERLDNIKCELVDLADNSGDFLDDAAAEPSSGGEPSKTVEAQVQPSVSEFIEADHSEYTGQEALSEGRLTSHSDVIDDLRDVTGTIFVDQSIYRATEVYSGGRKRPRPRRRRTDPGEDPVEDDGEISSDNPTAKVPRSSHIQALEEQLLRAQVREAEAAASAAEIQLQLNQLALQHAQAEEVRRKQLHSLRVRRLTQPAGDGDPHAQIG